MGHGLYKQRLLLILLLLLLLLLQQSLLLILQALQTFIPDHMAALFTVLLMEALHSQLDILILVTN